MGNDSIFYTLRVASDFDYWYDSLNLMISLDRITKKIGTRVLFDDVSAAFNRGNR